MTLAASFAALFVVAFGYGVIVPLAPTLLQGGMAAMSVKALSLHTGGLTATYLIAFAALAPLWGRAVDATSRSRIAAGGLAGFAVSYGFLAFAPRVEILYAALGLAGAFAAAVTPAVQVNLALVARERDRARMLSMFGSASFAGWFLGPPLASWSIASASLGGFKAGEIALALVALLGMLAAALALRRTTASGDGTSARATPSASDSRRKAWLFPALAMAGTFGIGAFEVSLVLWVVQVLRLAPALASRMLIECTIVMMAVQVVIFVLPAARPSWNPRAAAAAFIAMGVALAAMPLAGSAPVAYIAIAVIAASATLLQTMVSLGTVAASPARAGAALGLQLSLSSVGQGLGSLAAGAFFSASGGGFFVSAVVLGATGLWVLTLRE